MAKIKLLRSKAVQQLYLDIRDNLALYRSGNFDFIEADPSNYFEIEQEYSPEKLAKVACEPNNHREVECCVDIHDAMGSIPPYLARDARLWVWLTHTEMLEYARTRWPIPEVDGDAVKHIETHFFGKGARGIERDNAASRLWWMANLCSRVDGLTLSDALTDFLHQYDVRANIIERPTTSQSIPVFSSLLKKLDESYKGNKELFEREKFRSVMKELNLRGGVTLLEALDEAEIGRIVDQCVEQAE